MVLDYSGGKVNIQGEPGVEPVSKWMLFGLMRVKKKKQGLEDIPLLIHVLLLQHINRNS